MKRLPENFKISYLAKRPEHFQIVCQWLWKEWGRVAGESYEDTAYRTHHCLGKTCIPMTFIGLFDGMPIGTASLWRTDLSLRQDLSPWLSVLYVVPEMRNRGIGRALQQHALDEARNIGHSNLYLMTDHIGYYEKQGWSFVETAPLGNGKTTRIYKYALR